MIRRELMIEPHRQLIGVSGKGTHPRITCGVQPVPEAIIIRKRHGRQLLLHQPRRIRTRTQRITSKEIDGL